MIYLLREKSDTFEAYKLFRVWVLNQLGKRIKCLHTDHGGEYLSDKFNSFLDENGVERKLTVHDTPEENGVAERLNCTLQEKVHAMIYAAKLPEGLWGEALMHAAWLKNHTWTRSLPKGLTPYEMVTGETPVLCDVPEWGAIVWVHDTSNGKLCECAKEGHWVRYDLNSKGHRIYWLEKKNITIERSQT
jgi:transposase InsO family protein